MSFIECITRIRYLAGIFTFLVGIFLYMNSFIDFYYLIIGEKIIYINSIYASLFILFSPLWIQPFSVISNDLKDCSRIENIIILLFCLIGVVASNNQTIDKFGPLIFNFILILSGLCLSLSYFGFWKTFIRNFNKACNDCCLNCDDLCCCCPRYVTINCDCEIFKSCENCQCNDCPDFPDCDGDCVIMWLNYK